MFGLCFASTSPVNRSKFHPRALPTIFVGYSPGMKSYQFYNIEHKRFFVSRDVIFRESSFSFHTVSSQPIDDVDAFPDIILPKSYDFSGSSYPMLSFEPLTSTIEAVHANNAHANVQVSCSAQGSYS